MRTDHERKAVKRGMDLALDSELFSELEFRFKERAWQKNRLIEAVLGLLHVSTVDGGNEKAQIEKAVLALRSMNEEWIDTKIKELLDA